MEFRFFFLNFFLFMALVGVKGLNNNVRRTKKCLSTIEVSSDLQNRRYFFGQLLEMFVLFSQFYNPNTLSFPRNSHATLLSDGEKKRCVTRQIMAQETTVPPVYI